MGKEKANITEQYEDRYKNDCYAQVSYFINEAKKTIVCKIEPYVVTEPILSWEPLEEYISYTNNLDYKQSTSKSFFVMCGNTCTSFIGKAVCMDEDEFNVEFGKRLAYDKAMLKLLDAKKRFFAGHIKVFEKHITANQELITDVDKQIAKTTERFEKKIKEVM